MERSKVGWLDTIRRDIESLAEWAKKRPDILDRVVSDADLKKLESLVTDMGADFEIELELETELDQKQDSIK